MISRTPNTTRRSQRGFTLIELMVVAALFIIIAGFIFSLFVFTLRAAAVQEATIGMRDEARLTIERTMQLLRGATQIIGVDANGNLAGIGGGTVAQVSFIYPLDTDGDFIITSTAEYTGALTMGLDVGDADGDGLTTTEIVVLDDDGEVMDVLTRRAVAPNSDGGLGDAPNGGFILQASGSTMTVTVILQDPGFAAGGNPITITESRTFELKNV